jgi:hypothetical protein
MTEPDPAAAAQAFFDRKRADRLAEAGHLWPELVHAGFRDDMVLLLDFLLFGREEAGARALAAAVAQTYGTEVSALPDGGWRVVGTTRPYGARFDETRLRDWVAYLADLAAAHGMVFSVWAVEAPALGVSFTSEAFGPSGGAAA